MKFLLVFFLFIFLFPFKAKNVASEPANKICESVGAKLEGKVVGTFNRITSIVQEAVRETLVQVFFYFLFSLKL
jgi:hypothetical protein